MYSQKGNCMASFPIPTCDPGDIYKSLTDTLMSKLGDRTLLLCFGNNEAA